MIDLQNHCSIIELSPEELITDFDCGDCDLNDFFNRDAILFQSQMLGQTYFFRHNETGAIVCAFSLCADSVKTHLLPGSRRKKVKELIPRDKSLQSYPALLIGRLGVSAEFAGQGIGSQLMEHIKYHCINQYSKLARFLVVDAYNNPVVLAFYQRNDFLFVFSTEQQEEENLRKTPGDTALLQTRQMFFDMMRWQNKE